MPVEAKELDIDSSTEEKIREKLMMAMLESLYKQNMIDVNIYKKVKAEIRKS